MAKASSCLNLPQLACFCLPFFQLLPTVACMAQPTQQQAPRPRIRRGVQVKANKIRALREGTGDNVRTFATKVRISHQHMYNLENGCRPRASVEVAHRIANELGVQYEQIVDVEAVA